MRRDFSSDLRLRAPSSGAAIEIVRYTNFKINLDRDVKKKKNWTKEQQKLQGPRLWEMSQD